MLSPWVCEQCCYGKGTPFQFYGARVKEWSCHEAPLDHAVWVREKDDPPYFCSKRLEHAMALAKRKKGDKGTKVRG